MLTLQASVFRAMQSVRTLRRLHSTLSITRSRPNPQPTQAHLESWVRSYGSNSSSYVLLEGSKRYFTSPSVDGFLAYQISSGIAVIAGDPVCPVQQAPLLVQDFVHAMNGHPICAYQVSPLVLEAFRRSGFADVQVGKEAVFQLRQFTLAGGQMELVRAATNKARREGVVVAEHNPFTSDAELVNQEMREVTAEWLKSRGERELGFLLGSLGIEQASAKRYFLARSGNGTGRIEGFIVCEPIYGRNGYYLDVTRRRSDAVRGVMELLTTEIFRLLRNEGYEMASMGLAPLALLDDPDLKKHPRLTKLMRFAYEQVNNTYDFKLLYRYKAKFHPHAWETRYLCFNRARLSPRMLYAVVRVRNATTLSSLLRHRHNEIRGFQEKIKSWRHAASFAIGVLSALLSSSSL
jgi:phosphatidylglycerol lysyltransferase